MKELRISKRELESLKNAIAYNTANVTEKMVNETYKPYYETVTFNQNLAQDNPLFKINEDYISTRVEKTIPVDKAYDAIMSKYHFEPWQFRVIDKAQGEKGFSLTTPKMEELFNDVVKDLAHLGYYMAHYYQQLLWGKWFYVTTFEPEFQSPKNDGIRNYRFASHITPERNWNSIKEKGLVPQSKNKIFDYPNRLYLLNGANSIDDMFDMARLLKKVGIPDEEFAFIILGTVKIPDNVIFYPDPNRNNAFYTTQTIPTSAIRFKKTEIIK